MSVQRNLWTSWLCTAGVLVVGAFPSVGLCQSRPDQVVENTPTDPIEEIVVYGEQSLPSLHREVYRAEEKFFAVFNTVNDDDEYDINCGYEIPPFTHIRKHVCKANFTKDATAADYAGWRRGQPVVPFGTVILQKKRRLGLKMELLAAEHPELLEALNEYTEAKQILQSEKKKCEGSLIICQK